MRQRIRVSSALTVVLALLGLAPAAAAHPASPVAPVNPAVPAARATQDPGDGSLRVTKFPEDELHLRDFAPGDRTQWAAEVTNTGEDGDLGVEFVLVGESDALANEANALQIVVDLCSVAFDSAVSETGAMTFTCPATQTRLGLVTSAAEREMDSHTVIAAGDTVGVRARILFPASADNTAESTSAVMDVLVTVSPLSDDLSPSGGTDPETDTEGAPPEGTDDEAPRPALFGGLALTGIDVLLLLGAGIIIVSLGITFWTLAPRQHTRHHRQHRTRKDEEDV